MIFTFRRNYLILEQYKLSTLDFLINEKVSSKSRCKLFSIFQSFLLPIPFLLWILQESTHIISHRVNDVKLFSNIKRTQVTNLIFVFLLSKLVIRRLVNVFYYYSRLLFLFFLKVLIIMHVWIFLFAFFLESLNDSLEIIVCSF